MENENNVNELVTRLSNKENPFNFYLVIDDAEFF
jgi:hypothetical protein